MPCLHPSGLPSLARGAENPRQNNERAIRFICGRALIRSQRTAASQPRSCTRSSDTWLSEAAFEFLRSRREARRWILETHRLPKSGRFVEADSGGVKYAKARKHAAFQTSRGPASTRPHARRNGQKTRE